jgi:hypothetical protein
MIYNPNNAPNPDRWLSIDEIERITLVTAYHRQAKIKLPNERIHATIHVIIENQIAEGIPAVTETLNRLLKEDLDRHDAVHAIGSVLAKYIYKIAKGESIGIDPNDPYIKDVSSLTASSWLNETR